MEIPNKQELHKLHLTIHKILIMNLCKKCTAKPYSFLVIDATLASDNPSHFRENLLERI